MANGVPTLEDVARLAGVSKATASRILSAASGQEIPFAAETRERVCQAATKLGYHASRIARGLTASRTGIVGLVVPSVEDSFFPSVTSTIEAHLSRAGFSVILCNTHGDSAIEEQKIHDVLGWRSDGLIVVPSQGTGNAGVFWELWQHKVPFVLLDRTFSDTPFHSVVSEDQPGAKTAVEHLLSLGRRRIACVGGPFSISTCSLRRAGYTETLLHHRIVPEPELTTEVPSTFEGGRTALQQLMRLASPPDALFCFSDYVAAGAMFAAMDAGLRVPEDLAICGYADLDFAPLLKVPLTSVHQPRGLLARHTAEMLLALMDHRSPEPGNVHVPVELKVRESTVGASRGGKT